MAVKKGYKQTEVGVIPEDWIVAPITSVTSSIFLGLTSSVDYVESGGVPLVRATDIANGRLSFENARTISVAQHTRLTRYRQARRGDVLVSKSGSLGVCALVETDSDFSIYESIIVLQPRSMLDSRFLLSLLRAEATQTRMLGGKVGSTVSHLNLEMFRGLFIPFPPIPEQRAIATALSDADAWIESLQQLIAKKRQIKQGAMQELLTGKRRLPGVSGKWETKQIGLIADVGRGRVINHREIARSRNPKYPVYSSQTSNDGVMGFIDSFDFEGEFITWTTDGANAGTVFARKGRFNCTNVCGTIEVKQGDYRCIALALGRVAKNHVSKHLGNPKLMNDVMKRIEVCVPSSIAEQTAIATVLSDMDTEIESLESKLAKAREIKQGMMQELLTGRIRLV